MCYYEFKYVYSNFKCVILVKYVPILNTYISLQMCSQGSTLVPILYKTCRFFVLGPFDFFLNFCFYYKLTNYIHS